MRLGKLFKRVLDGFIIGFFVAYLAWQALPFVILTAKKDEILKPLDRAGFDVSECRKSKQSWTSPTAGMPFCMRSTYEDMARQMKRDMEEGRPSNDYEAMQDWMEQNKVGPYADDEE